ncbi:hypothetical protein GCM10009775_26510 [Microbacterium aoyamense]|uniref:Major facilitator superfamily (MFS) profile domain-containing protein n=1 Tax=Microbacterium aoyamense TaxID=344166 RepID=A0ABN2PVI6_9MICO|nr:MFS transporter [Microbacterium aoyamense]
MLSNVATGAATGSFLTLLLPPFVTDVTGQPWRVGVIFAALSLAAAVGPWVGAVVDRTRTHRVALTGSIAAMAAAYALLAIDAAVEWYSPLFGLLLGAAWATQGTIGPALIVGSPDPAAVTARRLTVYSLAYPAGVLFGAVIVAVSLALGVEPGAIFLVCALTLAGFAMVTWATAGPISRSLAASDTARPTTDREYATKSTVQRGQVTAFAAFLAVVFLSSLGSNGLVSQLANIMPAVYGFTPVATALLVGIAGLLNIATLILAGRAMARSTSMRVFTVGTVIRGVGALAMALIGLITSPVLILAALAMLVAYQGIPIPRLAAPDLAARLETRSPTRANGYYFASSALGSALGCVAAGLAAMSGYESVLWLASVAGLAASATALIWLPRAYR